MKALTIQEPWVSCILHHGKDEAYHDYYGVSAWEI